MKDLFKITVKIPEENDLELFFDDKDRAERFIHAIQEIMNENGRKSVVLIPELVTLIDSDEDIINALFHKDYEKKQV